MRRGAALVLAAAAALLAAAPAAAHIQVNPTVAAPGDAVRFELLVPNEQSGATTDIALQIPAGVLAFSFEETPGWTRTTTKAKDGSVGVVRWRGSLPAEGFVRFSFLASTPDKAGALEWKAVQTYADGTAVRWIGAPGSEQPAAVTEVTADAPRQNAGGESGEEEGDAAAPPAGEATATATPAPAAAAAPVAQSGGGGDGLAIAALAVAVLAALLAGAALLRRPRAPSVP